MGNELQVMSLSDAVGHAHALKGSRPIINAKMGPKSTPKIITPRGLEINSVLRRDEWETLDRAVVQASVQPLRLTRILRDRGLVRPLGSLGTLITQYNRVSEMTEANISLRGHASGEKDLVDFDLVGVPVPIIFKEFELDTRVLASSRLLGDGLDTTNGAAAARVVGEKVEDLAINGDSSINLNGNTIYGLTTHPNRNTDTAANFGGGDWGTITNIIPTIAGMISAAQADGYYGPYGVAVAPTQYNQAALAYYTDGSGDTPLQRVLNMPQIEFFEQIPQLDDGEVVLMQLTTDVIELAYVEAYFPITNLEWTSGDGMLEMFKAMAVFTPIVKSDHSGRSGIVHATGA